MGLEGRVGLCGWVEDGEDEVAVIEPERVHLLVWLLGVGRRAGFVHAAARAGAA